MKCLHFKTRTEVEAAESFQTFLNNIVNMTLDEHLRQLDVLDLSFRICQRLRNTYSENLAEHQQNVVEHLRELHNYQNRSPNADVEEPSGCRFSDVL
jgi:phosphoenolpyruvate-protein kinase (PTS system EI component)